MSGNWNVVATDMKTWDRRILSVYKSEAEAEACVKIAVMRRGVDKEFFTAEPELAAALDPHDSLAP